MKFLMHAVDNTSKEMSRNFTQLILGKENGGRRSKKNKNNCDFTVLDNFSYAG